MVRHIFVALLFAVCLLQVVWSMPERERRDADEAAAGASNILDGIQKAANDAANKVQEFFSGDSLKALQGNATQLANKVGEAFEGLVEKAKGAGSAAPSSA